MCLFLLEGRPTLLPGSSTSSLLFLFMATRSSPSAVPTLPTTPTTTPPLLGPMPLALTVATWGATLARLVTGPLETLAVGVSTSLELMAATDTEGSGTETLVVTAGTELVVLVGTLVLAVLAVGYTGNTGKAVVLAEESSMMGLLVLPPTSVGTTLAVPDCTGVGGVVRTGGTPLGTVATGGAGSTPAIVGGAWEAAAEVGPRGVAMLELCDDISVP